MIVDEVCVRSVAEPNIQNIAISNTPSVRLDFVLRHLTVV